MSSRDVCNISDPDFILFICSKYPIENIFAFFILWSIRIISIWLFRPLGNEPLATHNTWDTLFIYLNISQQKDFLNTTRTVTTFIFLEYIQYDFRKGFILNGSFTFASMQIIVKTRTWDFKDFTGLLDVIFVLIFFKKQKPHAFFCFKKAWSFFNRSFLKWTPKVRRNIVKQPKGLVVCAKRVASP